VIHEIKGSRAGNDQGAPLFFCTSCEEMFIGVVGMDGRSAQSDGWQPDRECPQCGYLEGFGEEVLDEEDEDDEDLEAGDPPLPSGANDDRS
jgi:hypothetical protein